MDYWLTKFSICFGKWLQSSILGKYLWFSCIERIWWMNTHIDVHSCSFFQSKFSPKQQKIKKITFHSIFFVNFRCVKLSHTWMCWSTMLEFQTRIIPMNHHPKLREQSFSRWNHWKKKSLQNWDWALVFKKKFPLKFSYW